MKDKKILVDEEKLNLLLDSKKQFIGNKVTLDSVLSSVSFLVSVVFASYDEVFGSFGKIFKYCFVALGIFFTCKTIKDVVDSKKNNYTFEDLLNDINKLNEIQHNHSIVIIKDTFNEFPNKYLVYNDSKWNCLLFPNYKDSENNVDFIIEHLSNELKISKSCISLKYIDQYISYKMSEKDKEYKVYNHKFYIASISDFPAYMKTETFVADGKDYHWKSMTELDQDENVAKKNSDILSHIKEIS